MNEALIRAEGVSKSFSPKAQKKTYAVTDVDLSIHKGEALGLVGESGCGKSTLAKLLLQLERNTKGDVYFHDKKISAMSDSALRPIRHDFQMVFQNSANTFNPYFTVKQVIMEPISGHEGSRQAKEQLVLEMMERLGLPQKFLNRYGSELSGGQRQRVGIARALITRPEFVVCDEAVSSLDYIIKKQILKLLLELKADMGLTYLFISHDLKAISEVCDRVVVMYMGNILEILPDSKADKLHPYTQSLYGASLSTDPRDRQKRKALFREGQDRCIPECGCVFQNRCLYTQAICKEQKPVLNDIGNQHRVACHLSSKGEKEECKTN